MIALNSPLKPNVKRLSILLERVNDIGWYTNFGPLHTELTEKLEDFLGVKNLLLTNNGTSALQIASRAIGSSSFLSTPFSFAATVSAFKWQQEDVAFADIDPCTLNLSPDAVEKAFQSGCKADSVLATHVYGNPCDVEAIQELSESHNYKVIYDAAHAFGVKVGNESILNYGDASTLSFHATKVFHTVEGGAIVFKDRASFEKAEELINFGIRPGRGIVSLGINAKLNEYQAAVGLINLECIDSILEHRAELFEYYRQQLIDLVELPSWHPEANYNGAYMPILLESKSDLDAVSNHLMKFDIQSRNYFSPSLDQVFSDSESYGCKTSNDVSSRILCLPLHAHLTRKDIDFIVSVIKCVK
ncbi:DegT/DnrJ/EryC1/StrS family aminotransferase [Vibrio parahaemolyticus]|uniref:DegT/DnrJ/EryC1/StrS aminotransferase family protein n=1 Tax=Vibrio parahaemolyticus TaxID=670 RepID=UPI001A8CD59F|nr:DegT/DnrJ/EryC1/StrS family aminotransferase [Vibrio parahaemolyticus]EJB8540139.1 DegT/DnrJ/EryC1/StrS family aminotransferase [Vibrio parahaemolyticus]MBO0186758.1 DegT/DnrJ/EryC1/StrS family aminotransferase [Vibrio parahaemolyticus]MBO0218251.1 DegT/DnrJ/EryC1/StrS family aminotransferase [Vibrio parahaemolyticus]MBY4624001.1 DegT/DnrJ/EryC1/StrS family aminotransferase [Vibrio parahaemolyticus]MCR9736828.1 DegT/DnrJ/EryC1/StrS family aminotransferase [Vibrio parahaemolyticus]